MSRSLQLQTILPRTQLAWARLFCRALSLFAVQGVIILVLYGVMGWGTPPDALPPGLRLDPLHGVIHLVWGVIGAFIGFWRPSAALRFTQVFAVFYLLLAVLGTFTDFHLGMQLELEENLLHWPLGLLAAVIGYAPSLLPGARGAAQQG